MTPAQRDYLLKEEHDALVKTHGAADGFRGNQYVKVVNGQNDQLPNSSGEMFQARKVVAKEHGIKESEVRRAVEFGRGLDEAEKVSPGIKEAVLSGSVKESKKIFIFARLLRDSMGGVEVIYYPPPVCYDGVTTRDDIELMFGTDIESKAGPQTRERAGHT